MGANQSVPMEARAARAITAQQVSAFLIAKNAEFEKFSGAILKNDINGDFILDMSEAELDDILRDLRVESAIHRRALKVVFKNFRENASAPSTVLLQAPLAALALSGGAASPPAAAPMSPSTPLPSPVASRQVKATIINY